MKVRLLLLAIGCVLSAASAQWLETTIYLPDSAGGVLQPRTVASDPAGTKVYIGGRTPGVSVLDAGTGQRRYRIATGGQVSAICHVPVRNKVYIASRESDSVTVADGSTGQVLASVAVGHGPAALACLPTGERVYCACAGWNGEVDSTVYEIDCSADTVRAVYFVGRDPTALLYNRVNDMLYCADRGSNTVSVIACSGPPSVLHIPVGLAPSALTCNTLDNKVYAANSGGMSVSVISGEQNQVIAEVPTGNEPVDLCYDSSANTVFCANGGSGNVAVIDGALDRVIATLVVGWHPGDLEFNPDANRVYCLSQYGAMVHVIDASANRVIDSVPVGAHTSALCCARAAGRLHCPDRSEAVVTVIDCGNDSVTARTRVGIEPEALAIDPSGSKVYCFGGTYPFDSVNMSVIDAAQNTVVRTLEVRMKGRPMKTCYNSADNKLYYLGFGPEAAAIDAQGDSVLAYIPVPDNAYGLAYAAAVDKVYIGGGYFDGYVAAIDGQGDTLVASMAIPGGGGVYEVSHNSGHNTVLGFGNQRGVFTVFDCGTDTGVGQFAGEENPGAALYSPLTDKVYMVSYVSGVLIVIDGATNEVRSRIDVGNGARDICLNTRDNMVYSVGTTTSSLYVIDGAGDSLLARLQFPSYAGEVEYDPDYNIVYCAYEDGDSQYVALVDGATERIVGRIQLGVSVSAMIADPAQDRMYVADQYSSCLHVIHTGAGGLESMTPQAPPPASGPGIVRGTIVLPGASASGRRASSVLLDIAGRKVAALVPGPNSVSSLAPGIYFVRTEGFGHSEIRKLILAK
jgi:YVTN family beta-propeller protein